MYLQIRKILLESYKVDIKQISPQTTNHNILWWFLKAHHDWHMKKLARLFLSVQPFPFKRWQGTILILKEQTGLLFLGFNDAKNILTFKKIQNSLHYEAEKMLFPLNVMFQIYKTTKKAVGDL